MKVLIATSECVPFAKTGGLADVSGALPKALRKRKQNVRVILPLYKKVNREKFNLKKLRGKLIIPIGDHYEEGYLFEGRIGEDIPAYFVENEKFFGRDELYRTAEGDYEDNDERFIFFSRAVLEAVKLVDFRPDVIHCHDWQTGLIPAYLSTLYRIDAFFAETATVYTIHNIAYQGVFSKETMFLAGFSWHDFVPERLEYFDQLNFMKAGLIFADVLTTVSPHYAREIRSSAEFGRGMEGILQSRSADLFGILNGLDYEEWDPAKDKFLPAIYSYNDLRGKEICKQFIQKELGFALDKNIPLLGMVSRLDPQKGLDLLSQVLPEFLKENIQVVILGKGDQVYHDLLTELAEKFPKNFSAQIKFDEGLAHRIYAGSDFFLMPSHFEPCGLGQMIAMGYAAAPIAYATGGLADTVINFDVRNGKGNGFMFTQYNTESLTTVLREALKVYKQKKYWEKLLTNMRISRFTWEKSAEEYIRLYQKAKEKKFEK